MFNRTQTGWRNPSPRRERDALLACSAPLPIAAAPNRTTVAPPPPSAAHYGALYVTIVISPQRTAVLLQIQPHFTKPRGCRHTIMTTNPHAAHPTNNSALPAAQPENIKNQTCLSRAANFRRVELPRSYYPNVAATPPAAASPRPTPAASWDKACRARREGGPSA